MKISLMKSVPTLGARQRIGLIVAALLIVGAAGGWVSTMFTTSAVAVEDLSAFEVFHNHVMKQSPDELKPGFIGPPSWDATDIPSREDHVSCRMADLFSLQRAFSLFRSRSCR